jgi:hypothetical protein
MAGTQFCPRCVGALEAIIAGDVEGEAHALEPTPELLAS